MNLIELAERVEKASGPDRELDAEIARLNGLRVVDEGHPLGRYVRDGVTTNGVESVFAVLKRGLIGVYHHASPKHLGRYVNEFAFRLNDGDVKRHTLERLNSFILASAGRRLTYRELTA